MSMYTDELRTYHIYMPFCILCVVSCRA